MEIHETGRDLVSFPTGVLSTLFLILPVLVVCGCGSGAPRELVLFDFEADAELDRLHWQCHTLYSLSPEHATHGGSSLKLELFPSTYPGLTPVLRVNDWGPYNELRFDAYNPQTQDVSVTVRIDDRKDYPEYSDRFNKRFSLKPGQNQVVIPLSTLVTSGTKRLLDARHVCRLLVFMKDPSVKTVLYVDYIRLVRDVL